MSIRSALDRVFRRRNIRLIHESNLGLVAGDVYLKRLFREFGFDFVFDVGANTGQYALRLRAEAAYAGHILSVEPIPELAQTLRSALAGDLHWSQLECAIDREEGTAEFNVMTGSQFSSLLTAAPKFKASFGGKTEILQRVQVPVRTLESVFLEAQTQREFTNAFLKLDTQGTELRILEGATNVLPRIAAVQIEIAFTAIYDGAPETPRIFAFMSDSGYELSGLFANNLGHFPRLLEMDAVFVRQEAMPSIAAIK